MVRTMTRLNHGGNISSGNISGVHPTTTSSPLHPSYLISGQNALKRTLSTATTNTPILRSSAATTYLPAPSSGSGISELASLMNTNNTNKSGSAIADPSPLSHRSSIASVGSPHIGRKISRTAAGLLSPRTNPSNMRRTVSVDDATGVVLPLVSQNIYNNNHNHDNVDRAPQKPSRSSIMRAAESGKGSLLPTRGKLAASSPQIAFVRPKRTPKREAPGRSRSSGPSYSTATLPRTRQDIVGGSGNGSGGVGRSSSPQISVKSKLAYLRRRTATASSDDEFDLASQKARRESNYRSSGGGNRRSSAASVSSTGSSGTGRDRSNSRRSTGLRGLQNQFMMKLSRLKLGHVLQVVIVLAVMALVYESHNKALFATSQLMKFKEEESLLLLHLQKIEQQSIQLHENIGRLARAGIRGGGDSVAADNNDGDKITAGGGGGIGDGTGRDVDFDLIHKQTQQLYQMEEELNHEVKTLQSRIQLSARNHIIQAFGEGPVQVVLELDFGSSQDNAGPRRISILLWHDTPHAAWTWLEQIGNNLWEGAEFQWQKGHIIDTVPIRNDPDQGKIQFLEHSQHAHQAWTIGVHESDAGSLGMYINLQDNSELHKHETCVGKVVDGFDALQKVLEAARGEKESSVAIRKATAMHYVTKKAGMQ